jgi:hypothetical protein
MLGKIGRRRERDQPSGIGDLPLLAAQEAGDFSGFRSAMLVCEAARRMLEKL